MFYAGEVQTFHHPADAPRRVAHVWVKYDLDGTLQPLPGLVLDWRQAADGWEAWVVSVSTFSTGSGQKPMIRQSWVPVHFLRPVEAAVPDRAAWSSGRAKTPPPPRW